MRIFQTSPSRTWSKVLLGGRTPPNRAFDYSRGSGAGAGCLPLDESRDCIDKDYRIKRKRGQVVAFPSRHFNAVLADNGQVAGHTLVEQPDCRIARTDRHDVIAAYQRINFRTAEEQRSLFKPRIVRVVPVTFRLEPKAMPSQGTAEPVPTLLVYPAGTPTAQIGEVPATVADQLVDNL